MHWSWRGVQPFIQLLVLLLCSCILQPICTCCRIISFKSATCLRKSTALCASLALFSFRSLTLRSRCCMRSNLRCRHLRAASLLRARLRSNLRLSWLWPVAWLGAMLAARGGRGWSPMIVLTAAGGCAHAAWLVEVKRVRGGDWGTRAAAAIRLHEQGTVPEAGVCCWAMLARKLPPVLLMLTVPPTATTVDGMTDSWPTTVWCPNAVL